MKKLTSVILGFLPNSFLFTWKSKIVSIILSLLKLEHSSSPQRPRVQRPALQTTNIDQRPPPPAVRLHRHHTKRHHEVAHWKRASQWFFRTSTAGSRIFKGARQIWDFEIWRWCCNNLEGSRCCSLFRAQLMRRDPTQLPKAKQRATSTSFEVIAAPTSNLKSQICRAPLKIRLPAVEVRVIVEKIAPTSVNMKKGQRQRPLDGREHNI